ncbi:ABC-2 type transport system permease protein [Desulfuromusa kysingii]|uniref:ABC-2 type transport system permease protein n=1 Tax=Desulfuromusa kysingii TaxID=37625 RepID=A0A1H4BLX9_9BACT|nr:ABC transporter permease [Desulfuromusa kysingii]SEA49131.1 ABC-2 type transport system permease protein [Desulfuromusa kysingii]
MMKFGLFILRMRGILLKESFQILRDPSSIALALVMPIVLLFIFGYGVTLDANDVPIAVVADDHSTQSTDLIKRFELSENFTVVPVLTTAQGEQLLAESKVDGIIHIQDNFTEKLQSGNTAPVQLIINGVDANRTRVIQGYAQAILGEWSSIRISRGDDTASSAVTINQRVWFNEAVESRNFMVPGLITLIMTLTGILLTSLVIAREWERGTMEAMLVTPLRRIDILLGKIIPYYILGMGGMGLSVGFAIVVFKVPFRGSITVLFLLSSLFMLASLGFGLLLSATIRNQFVAAQISIITGFLPAVFLTGLIFDLESTPQAIQIISLLVPAHYFISISHTLFMAGDIWSVLLPNGLVLAAMSLIFIAVAYKKITKRLEG